METDPNLQWVGNQLVRFTMPLKVTFWCPVSEKEFTLEYKTFPVTIKVECDIHTSSTLEQVGRGKDFVETWAKQFRSYVNDDLIECPMCGWMDIQLRGIN